MPKNALICSRTWRQSNADTKLVKRTFGRCRIWKMTRIEGAQAILTQAIVKNLPECKLWIQKWSASKWHLQLISLHNLCIDNRTEAIFGTCKIFWNLKLKVLVLKITLPMLLNGNACPLPIVICFAPLQVVCNERLPRLAIRWSFTLESVIHGSLAWLLCDPMSIIANLVGGCFPWLVSRKFNMMV